MARKFSWKIRLEIPLEDLNDFTDTVTLVENWMEGQPEGSDFTYHHHKSSLGDSPLPHWIEVLLDIKITSVGEAGTQRGQIEAALGDLPAGTKPGYAYKEWED